MCTFDPKIKSILLQCIKLRTLSIQLPINVISTDWSVRVTSLESVELIAYDVQNFDSFFDKNKKLKNIKIVQTSL